MNKNQPDNQPQTIPTKGSISTQQTRLHTENPAQGKETPISPVASVLHQSEHIPEIQEKALTQFKQAFAQQTNEQGFVDVQNEVNQALAENKIVLKNRFVLESILGAGGMGTVYKAQDLRKVEAQDSHPYVATKILNSDFRKHPDAFVSLQREASRSHLLSHPNIVTVHDFDRDGNTIFMTMELLQGEDLDTFLRRYKGKGVAKEQALEIFKDFAHALSYAHEKGIIHSDLKPANIFITPDGAKVLDFGIARIAAESRYQDHFDAGSIGALTPAYASLEMIGNQPPEACDDVYAAAIMAYELLSGIHPYHGKSAAAALSLGMKPKRIPKLSKRQWKGLEKALKLRREERTATIDELLQALTVTPKFPLFKIVSIVLLTVLSWFVYVKFFVPDELSIFVEETLVRANQCHLQQDFACVINNASAILKIAPEHSEANSMLRKAEDAYAQYEKELKIENQLQSIQQCLAQLDYQCVITAANTILANDAQHQQAKDFLIRAKASIKQQQQLLAVEDREFTSLMKKASDCFASKNYLCAIKNAQLAQQKRPDDMTAQSLLQNSNYAQQQQQENLRKANKILVDGQLCFRKLDYSCAIAKSESALEFVPDYQEALNLKQEAMRSMENVKGAIEIQ